MKKIICSLLFLGSCFLINAQLVFQIGNISGNINDTVTVPVSVVSGFTKLSTMQYSMKYDSNVLAIVDYTKIPDVNNPGFLVYDVEMGTHVGSASVKNGELTFSWSEPSLNGKTISNGTTLFNLRFKLIGKECDSSFVSVVNKPLSIEVLDNNFDNVNFTANPGKIKINGSGCVVNPPAGGLELIASTETTPVGVVKCIKITAKDFKNIQTAQFAIKWDKAVAKFESLTSGALTLLFGQNYAAFSDSSGVGITWDAGRDPLTVADGTTLFEVCLRPVGASGTMTAINFDGLMGVIEFTDGNDNIVTPKFTAGKLTITGAALNLYYRDTMVSEPGPYCIPIRADNFKCMESFQFGMVFDTTKLKFDHFNFILPTLNLTHVNVVKDSIRVSWDASSGSQDLPNGGIILEVCFTSKTTPCPFDTKLRFTDFLGGPIEFNDCNGSTFAVTKNEPNINVKCKVNNPVVITLGSATPVKCFEDCNGTITGTTLTGGVGPQFDYEWRWIEQGGVIVSNTLDPVTDLCAGTYQLTVIDRGNANATTTSNTIIVTSPTEIRDSASVTHVVNGNDGKIDLMVGGGTPTYTFKWIRLSSGSMVGTSEDLNNIPANDYEVTITDKNGCIKKDTFTVNPAPFKIVSITQIDSSKCAGECKGSLFVSASGGKIPYRYKWSNGDSINPATKLCAGTYTVTATDNAGTTSTRTYTISEPDSINITIDNIVKSSGSNGEINITVKGGTPYKRTGRAPYDYVWKNATGTTVSTQEDLKNAAPGVYYVCVSDTFNCTKCDTQIIMSDGGVDTPIITITLAIDPKTGNRDVSCRGKCDGRITATVTSTIPKDPYTYLWSNGAKTKVITDLCPGQSYSVTVTDNAGNTKASTALIVKDAPPITLSSKKIQCASDKTTLDGSYEAITGGVVEPVSYKWCNGNINKIANDLQAGNCSISVTDFNGCTASETFLVCDETGPTIDCYLGRLAISPNGDGYNDELKIECATENENLLTIYDRWGNVVYSKVNYTNDWTGVDADGDDLTEGTYMWILKVKESGKNDAYYKGTVTIVR